MQFDSASDRFDSTGEFYKQTVAGGPHHTSAVLSDERRHEFAMNPLEPGKRALLIETHKARVARHISGKNRGKVTLCSSGLKHGGLHNTSRG